MLLLMLIAPPPVLELELDPAPVGVELIGGVVPGKAGTLPGTVVVGVGATCCSVGSTTWKSYERSLVSFPSPR